MECGRFVYKVRYFPSYVDWKRFKIPQSDSSMFLLLTANMVPIFSKRNNFVFIAVLLLYSIYLPNDDSSEHWFELKLGDITLKLGMHSGKVFRQIFSLATFDLEFKIISSVYTYNIIII